MCLFKSVRRHAAGFLGSAMVWANTRHRNRRVVIALPDFTYAVILADRGAHIMLQTTYVVDEAYLRKQMRAEWERSGGEDPLKG